ncbi:Crp/Fnr family transcriptional regulator [Methylobacterium oryzisoli]|uniref:Crp/Fnr family transcriptional regulator n=1 Tax=Methylobacterium oryzisoli TaxID=3385502 RepID=UPI003891D92B
MHNSRQAQRDGQVAIADEMRSTSAPTPPRSVNVPARADIFDECGSESVVILLEGLACVYRILPDGSRRIVALILPGESFCGQVPDSRRQGYSVGTLTACRVMRVFPRPGSPLAEWNPKVAEALQRDVFLRMNTMQEWLCNVGRGSDRQLAHLFCELFVRLQAIGFADETGFELDITQTDLADMIGISPVHTNRVLKVLARKKLVEWRSRRVEIPDVGRLKAFAAFAPHYLNGATPALSPRPVEA